MRAFVFLLILVNLLFLAWTQGYLGSSSNPDSLRVGQQLLANQVRIVARDERPVDTIKNEITAKAFVNNSVQVCILLSDLPIAEIVRLEILLAEKWPSVKSARIAERTVTPLSASLEIRGPDAQAEALRKAIAETLPESKPGACNNQARSAQ